ncbi:hypothetical protein BKA65DRAFT_545199 [Rhexocercosporidium sp. MPI-PUGE-AT-0058]|nr:hypothetical protein BKA65DRAFT_545199 [Rhexocercosporidium sp. MPI-PUGE-AT-0058]
MLSLRQQTYILLALSALLSTSACNRGNQHLMGTDHKNPSITRVEVVNVSPAPGSVQRYTEPGSCSSSLPITTNSITYPADECLNLNPHSIAQIQILSPAICPNGTRAVFTVFGSSNCWGSVSETTEVSDQVVGRCIDASQVWSYAFVCEGLPDGVPWGKIAAIVGVVGGLAVVGLGLLTGLFFCGGGLVFISLLGLCLWGFWILMGLVRKGLGFGTESLGSNGTVDEAQEEGEGKKSI